MGSGITKVEGTQDLRGHEVNVMQEKRGWAVRLPRWREPRTKGAMKSM